MMAANQEVTRIWWDEHRHAFDLYVSAAVRDEAMRGDEHAVQRRLEIIDMLEELAVTEIADQILQQSLLPHKAALDALHIAVAAVNRMDYLLTWNCPHRQCDAAIAGFRVDRVEGTDAADHLHTRRIDRRRHR